MGNRIGFGFMIGLFIAFGLSSCSNDNTEVAAVGLYPESGLLGQQITIQMQHAPVNALQVFFDNEEAEVLYYNGAIKVRIPRTLTRYNPVMKIIDLTRNVTILQTNFLLKAPVITGFSAPQVTFGEVFTIQGSNFDTEREDIKVFVNDAPAVVGTITYNTIEIFMPTAISTANLQVKVVAQRQATISAVPLQIKAPVISSVSTPYIWLGSVYVVNGQNFNPDAQFGQVTINGIPCDFSATNTRLDIRVPPGPYPDFTVTNITYQTGGLSTSYTTPIPISNDGIMVNYRERSYYTVFVHNNKAYALTSNQGGFNYPYHYTIDEFSPVTEKWTTLSSFEYTGNISDAFYDGQDDLYLYKYLPDTESYTLTRVNMNTFAETTIALPYNKIYGPSLFAYQGNVYLLSGQNNINGVVSIRTEKYQYSEASNTWTTLPSSAFSGIPLVTIYGPGTCEYLHFGNDIYLRHGIDHRTYKVNPSLSVTMYPYEFCFGYQNAVIGLSGTSNFPTLYNINTNAYVNMQPDFLNNSNAFFTVNNEIYFIRGAWGGYHLNATFTQKLRKSTIYGIL